MNAPDDFPGLAEQEQRGEQARDLLERAARTVAALDPGDWREQAARLRVAASDAEHAAQRLRELVGYLEAAHAAMVAETSAITPNGPLTGYEHRTRSSVEVP